MAFTALIVWLLVLGFVAWIVQIAPFIEPKFKSFIIFVMIAIAGLLVLSFLLNGLGLVGGSALNFRLK